MQRSLSKTNMLVLLLAVPAILAFALPPASAGARPTDGTEEGGSTATTEDTSQNICESTAARCNRFIEDYINPFIYLLSGLVGVLAVISIIVAGIQYSSSADDPSAVSKAKQRIFNTVIGLVAYIFLFAFFEYLVPGGFF